MANDVLFGKVSSSKFNTFIDKDENTLYFLTDTKEIFLGEDRYAFGQDTSVVIEGDGDVVEHTSYDAASKTLTIKLGKASDAESLKPLFDFTKGVFVRSVEGAQDGPIEVVTDDKGTATVDFKINNTTPGNVAIDASSEGLTANVQFPDPEVAGVADGDKIVSLDGDKIKSTLSISTSVENGKTFVVLRGIGGATISKFDASDFVKDGLLDSVGLESDPVTSATLLVFNFNTDSGKQAIKVDLSSLIDVYTAKADGGIVVEDNEISLENTVEPSTGLLNSNISPKFGELVTLHTIQYDNHGLIINSGDFTFQVPSITSATVGGDGKVITKVSMDDQGNITGDTLDIVTTLDTNSSDTALPTAKAVQEAVESVRTVWHRL